MGIHCCHNCTRPEKSFRCHSTCPEYAKEKAQHDLIMKKQRLRKQTDSALDFLDFKRFEK